MGLLQEGPWQARAEPLLSVGARFPREPHRGSPSSRSRHTVNYRNAANTSAPHPDVGSATRRNTRPAQVAKVTKRSGSRKTSSRAGALSLLVGTLLSRVRRAARADAVAGILARSERPTYNRGSSVGEACGSEAGALGGPSPIRYEKSTFEGTFHARRRFI
jgi:hypothetical protein